MGSGQIYLVNVASGKSELLATGYQALDYEAAGVYAIPDRRSGNKPGLFLITVPSGTVTTLTDQGYYTVADESAAYGNDAPAYPQGVPNRVISYEYRSRAVTTVVESAPGRQLITIIGFDGSGHPVVTSNQAVHLLYGPNDLRAIATGVSVQSLFADSHGLWMSGYVQSYNGGAAYLFLYAGGVLQVVSSVTGIIAGGCA